eukprot:6211903-Pleurochrysis_carterae.AAC.3
MQVGGVQLRAGSMATSPFRRPPRVNAGAQVNDFPQLLDNNQWTQAATFSQDGRFSAPSDRIGRYYRQQLNEMSEAQLDQRKSERTQPASPLRPTVERSGWAAGLACKPLLSPLTAAEAPAADPLNSSAFAILRRQRTAEENDAQAWRSTPRDQQCFRARSGRRTWKTPRPCRQACGSYAPARYPIVARRFRCCMCLLRLEVANV